MRLKTLLVMVGIEVCGLAQPNKALPFPANGASLDSLENGVVSMSLEGATIHLGFDRKGFVVKTPFHGILADQEKSFGKRLGSERITLDKSLSEIDVQAIFKRGDRYWLFDGKTFDLTILAAKDWSYIDKKSLVWDLIRPPRDRGGEATKAETRELRQKFQKSYYQLNDHRVSGVAFDAGQWLGKDAEYFFASTRLKGFPVVSFRCTKDNYCTVDRACYGARDEAYNGIAVDSQRRQLLLLGDRQVDVVRFSSCLEMRYSHSLALPQQIKKPSSIMIDAEDRLWLTSSVPDDFHNASAYVFSDWRKLFSAPTAASKHP